MGNLFMQTYYGNTLQERVMLAGFNAEVRGLSFPSQILKHVQTGEQS